MKKLLFFLLIWFTMCPAMGQNATVSVGQPVCIAVKLRSKPNKTLSAVGIRWRWNTHEIYYIDQNSDCINQVKLGDVIVSENGMSPEVFRFQGYYLNDVNTPVTLVLSRHGYQYSVICLRHPVAAFGPGWQER